VVIISRALLGILGFSICSTPECHPLFMVSHPLGMCWAVALCFSRLSSDVSEIKLVFSIPARRPTPTSRRTGKSPSRTCP
jgi:hypothetical protein